GVQRIGSCSTAGLVTPPMRLASHREGGFDGVMQTAPRLSGAQTSWLVHLTAPEDEGFLDGLLSMHALWHGQHGAATLVIDDRDAKPGALFQQFHSALYIVFGRGGTEEKESGDLLRSKPSQRHSSSVLGRFHQNARNVRNPAKGKIGREP